MNFEFFILILIQRRLTLLDKTLNNSNMLNTKLTTKDLVVVIDEATRMLRTRFEEAILFYQEKNVQKLFDDENVTQGDWTSKFYLDFSF